MGLGFRGEGRKLSGLKIEDYWFRFSGAGLRVKGSALALFSLGKKLQSLGCI